MKVSEFMSAHRSFILGNVSQSYFGDTEYLGKIYSGLVDIFLRMSVSGTWFYNSIEESSIAEDGSTAVYKSTYPILRMYNYKDELGTHIEDGVKIGDNRYTFKPFFLDTSDTYKYTFQTGSGDDIGSIIGVKLPTTGLGNVRLRYYRLPKKIVNTELAAQVLDLPAELTEALADYVSSTILPSTFYEEGANIGNFRWGKYIDKITAYGSALGMNMPTSFVYSK